MQARQLIMELTHEQGGGRESQVQPPSEVWEQFFGVRVTTTVRPTFRLQNMKVRTDPEQRKVVKHHHNLTLEIGDAKLPRPAILRMRRTGHNAFEYWVYRPQSQGYQHCDWVLANLAEDVASERRWIVI
ncbi:MAG: hypothetical protein IH977_11020 [Nitrospinae bacterium]|nr:hypothetical protein [Nitrospinota bacterium]